MKRFDTGNTWMAYAEDGPEEGRPVVFLHGATVDHVSMKNTFEPYFAGANGGSVADVFESAEALDANLEVKSIPKSGAEFSYRSSSLSSSTILAATFLLKPDKPSEILKRIDAIMARRVAAQPHLPSAGSVFKNPA
ncbi:MAG: hypothetical protein CVU79_10565, partial [Elusimicrobia bacterium HGW-Elusimicrobia-3]